MMKGGVSIIQMIGPKKDEGWVPLKAKQADPGRQEAAAAKEDGT